MGDGKYVEDSAMLLPLNPVVKSSIPVRQIDLQALLRQQVDLLPFICFRLLFC